MGADCTKPRRSVLNSNNSSKNHPDLSVIHARVDKCVAEQVRAVARRERVSLRAVVEKTLREAMTEYQLAAEGDRR
jgi:hypothetical protein